MKEIIIKRNDIQAGELTSILRGSLGDLLIGISTYPDHASIWLADEADDQAQALSEQIAANYRASISLVDQFLADLQIAQMEAETTPLDKLTVAQAADWISTNVTDLPSAKQALIILAKIVDIQQRQIALLMDRLNSQKELPK
jgi:DNA-directed RNA polymerase specialized sigma24 family protein